MLKYKEIKKDKNKLRHQIERIVALVVSIIYLIVSFKTMAWHLTWVIWIIYGLFVEVLKLIFMLRSNENEK